MPKLDLRKAGLTYSACGPVTKHREKVQKFRETGNLKHWYRNEIGKAWLAQNSAYSDSKDLANRTISGKFLK